MTEISHLPSTTSCYSGFQKLVKKGQWMKMCAHKVLVLYISSWAQKEKKNNLKDGKTSNKLKFVLKTSFSSSPKGFHQYIPRRGPTRPFQKPWLKSWKSIAKSPPPYVFTATFLYRRGSHLLLSQSRCLWEVRRAYPLVFQQYEFNIMLYSRRLWKLRNGFP